MTQQHEHSWQGPRFSAHSRMLIQLCRCGIIKRTTCRGTKYDLYHDEYQMSGSVMPENHEITDDDFVLLDGFISRAAHDEDPDEQEYQRKQMMSPSELNKLAEQERVTSEQAVTEHGYGSIVTLDAIASYESSLDILMYGNFKI